MCYDIKVSFEAQLKRAKRKGDLDAVEEIMEQLIPLTDLPIYHTTGFNHPDLLIYTNETPDFPIVATWGLIPHWVKDEKQQRELWNNTLNARGETMFEKPSFKQSALSKRCIIPIDGFYEHHHYNNNTYPYFIQRKDEEPLSIAGLWNEWTNPETNVTLNTFSIVTTVGNPMMAKIHNNPKIKGPRMPLILPEKFEDAWLHRIENHLDKQKIQELIQSFPEDELKAHTVGRLRGKEYKGNVENITEKVVYGELDQMSLF